MPRQASKATLKVKAHRLMQKLVRMKAADSDGFAKCVTCGVINHYKQMDGGHFLSRSYSFHSLREENIHPQCKTCNRYMGKVHDDYRLYMVDMYGVEFVDWLTKTKWTITKRSVVDYQDVISDVNERIKDQEVRLGER